MQEDNINIIKALMKLILDRVEFLKRRFFALARSYVVWNWDWTLDAALRYEKAVSIIRKQKPNSVVDIGSGSRGISAYAKYPSFGVDLSFNDSLDSGLQKRITASGTKLPFDNRSIDFVVSADTLEHASSRIRPLFIKEMFRIVKESGIVYISVPVGPDAEEADRKMDNLYKLKHTVAYSFLSEHIKYGIPDAEEIVNIVKDEAGHLGWRVTVMENNPIWIWEWNFKLFAVELLIPGLRNFQRLLIKSIYPVLKRIKSNRNYRIILIASRMDC